MILHNKAYCKLCKDVIESKSRHHFVECSCGEIFTDGGHDYIRQGAKNLDNLVDMSEYVKDEKEQL